ncbi:MAG: hypothetical protein EBV23_14460 [Flavobacteriia bacterium]|nr:hypothetical protein [Flavobacteriia bacterium]
MFIQKLHPQHPLQHQHLLPLPHLLLHKHQQPTVEMKLYRLMHQSVFQVKQHTIFVIVVQIIIKTVLFQQLL